MKAIRGACLLGVCLLIVPALEGSTSGQLKTLTRVHDPVVMECKQLKPLFGFPIDNLALMAKSGGAWAPIPFQIDQKKPDGTYAFEAGPGASKDPDPNLDANDELVFMVKDTGDRAIGGNWPEGATAAVELEITDPKNDRKGWVYLIRFRGKAPRSKKDYVRVETDMAKKRRRVVTYEYVMGGPMDRMYPDLIRAVTGPTGNPGLDVLDRLKIRGKITLLGGITLPYYMDELTKAKDIGYIDGPVRVLHFAKGYIELTRHIKLKGKGHSIISYYSNHMIWPMKIDLPFGKIVKKMTTNGYMDFCPTAYGSFVFNAANPLNKDVVLDGRMSEAEKHLDTKTEIGWNAGFGPQGAIINRLIVVPKGKTRLFTYYRDDKTADGSPEDCPGVSAVGYKITGTIDIPPDTVFYQYYYFLRKLKPEQVTQILDILDYPVRVTVRPIALH